MNKPLFLVTTLFFLAFHRTLEGSHNDKQYVPWSSFGNLFKRMPLPGFKENFLRKFTSIQKKFFETSVFFLKNYWKELSFSTLFLGLFFHLYRYNANMDHDMDDDDASPLFVPNQGTSVDFLPKPVGLPNNGANACYINAALQFLIAMPRLFQVIHANQNISPAQLLVKELYQYSRALRNKAFGFEQKFKEAHNKLISYILQLTRRVEHSQEDAHEVVIKLLEQLEKEAKDDAALMAVLTAAQIKTCITRKRLSDNHMSESPVDSQYFLNLPMLAQSSDKKPIAVNDLWEGYFKPKDIEFQRQDVENPTYNDPELTDYQERVETVLPLPAVLLIYFNKSLEMLNKPIQVSPILKIQDSTYHLKAFIRRYSAGGDYQDGGHYIAAVENDGQFYRCNDETISKKSRSLKDDMKNAMCVMYVKQHHLDHLDELD